jgi:hypothetical protein
MVAKGALVLLVTLGVLHVAVAGDTDPDTSADLLPPS